MLSRHIDLASVLPFQHLRAYLIEVSLNVDVCLWGCCFGYGNLKSFKVTKQKLLALLMALKRLINVCDFLNIVFIAELQTEE